ncbi:MAG: class I SAM-dependent methyltransferase, partial [Gaiellaceae bacterium]
MTLEQLVADLVAGEELTHATLSKPRRADPSRYSKVTVRPVLVGGALRYGWTYHYATRTTGETLAPAETARHLLSLLRDSFRQGLLHGREADYQVLAGKTAKILERPATRPERSLEHDRRKRYLLPEGTPVPFLVELGVMNAAGKVLARHYDKFRQVNRFLELAGDVLPALPEGRLRIVDFGSGKSYLTFALHHFLTAVAGRRVELLGLDLKEDVVERCAALAARLGCEGLRFEVGDIAGHEGFDRVDLVVSLHACDTATDAALERAVRWEAHAILAVPCCQHELLGQIENAALAPLLGHGLLRERFAAEVTDAARAQLLRLAGYDVQLVEFVALEHTPKNVLIRAVRRPGRDTDRLAREYGEFKRALGIDPYLERALRDRLAL